MTVVVRVKFNLRTRLARKGLFVLLPMNSEHESEVRLFRAVLDKALYDCLDADNAKVRTEALEWVSTDNEDFVEVCTLAMLNPEFVKDKFQRYLEYYEETGGGPVEEIILEE
jgi:hypothetical protein